MGPTTKISPGSTKRADSANIDREETPFEALASICSVLVVGLFILTSLSPELHLIPSGSMENMLLVGDHTGRRPDLRDVNAARFLDAAHQVSQEAEARGDIVVASTSPSISLVLMPLTPDRNTTIHSW